MTSPGTVYLVGAGPGDPGLITVRGLELLKRAQVVVFDRLVDRRLLEAAAPDAELVDGGKGPGQKAMQQHEINALLVQRGLEGKDVVRLKGGDPFLFGRGGEEAEALAQAGVPFEVVPGVTSAVAVPAYAGIPVTHRGLSSSMAVVTGSEDPAKEASSVDWAVLARATDTLVVLMGLANLRSVAAALLAAGREPDTPVALVRWGTTPQQQVVTGTLATIADRAEAAKLTSPVVAVVGEVVRLREKLTWFECRPLFGKRVLVTRTRQQAGVLSELVAEQGALPVELPTIEVVPTQDWALLDRALAGPGLYRWAVFTSVNAVELVFGRLAELGKDARALGGTQVCAIGAGTAAALRARGIVADLVPAEFVSESILDALRGRVAPGDRVLLPRAVEVRDVLPRGLRDFGAHVEEVPLYHLRVPKDAPAQAARVLQEGVDIVTFTSSSTVKNLIGLLNGDTRLLSKAVIASIGPVTSATLRQHGLRVDVEAPEHTVPGLVRALVEHVRIHSLTLPSPTGRESA